MCQHLIAPLRGVLRRRSPIIVTPPTSPSSELLRDCRCSARNDQTAVRLSDVLLGYISLVADVPSDFHHRMGGRF